MQIKLANVFIHGQGVMDMSLEDGLISEISPAAPGIAPTRFVMPGFIDAHCHILPTGLDLLKLDLQSAANPEELLEIVAAEHCRTPGESWLQAVNYDQSKFAGAIHITRHQLDQISDTRPILLRHVNRHASVANSAALRLAGVLSSSPDPKGGTFERDASGSLTGVLLERAHQQVSDTLPAPGIPEMVAAILAAGSEMSRFGITAATDMMTGSFNLANELTAYRLAAEQGCAVRLRLCLQWGTVLGPRALDPILRTELIDAMDDDTCKVIGLKIFADGAIGSATAAIYRNFLTTGGQGQLIYSPERLASMVKKGHDAGWQIAVHSIGDRATDLVMDAFAATDEPARHRLEHAMILSDEQILRLARLGCHTTMQPEFLIRFGHAYRAQLPPDQFPHLKRVRSCLDAGVPMSFNSDRPIVLGDPWTGMAAAVSRPEGFDPRENISIKAAIDGYTIGGAAANGDVGSQGSLSEGFCADFQVYDGEPGPKNRPLETWVAGGKVLTR